MEVIEVVLASKIATAMIMLQLVANCMKEIEKNIANIPFCKFFEKLPAATETVNWWIDEPLGVSYYAVGLVKQLILRKLRANGQFQIRKTWKR